MNLFTRIDAPRLRPLEVPASFVSRLAAWLRYSNANQFCFDFDLDFAGISGGNAEKLQLLAELTETPIEALSHGPIRQGRQFAIEGEVLSTSYLDRIDLWICPECAKEDMDSAPHLPPEAAIAMRRDEIVTAIGSCAQHRRAFVNFGRQDWKSNRHDTSMTTVDVAVRLEEFFAASSRTDQSPIDAFVRERFAGTRQGYGLLDPLSLNDVLKLCGPFGNWRLTKGETNLRRLPRRELNRYLSAGLETLAGKEGIARAIDDVGRRANGLPRHAVVTYINTIMAEMRGPRTSELRSIVSCAARDHRRAAGPNLRIVLPAAAEHPDRRWCTIQSIIDRHRTGPKAAVAFAKAAGALHEVGGVLQVDVDLLDAWMVADGGIVASNKVAEQVGATDYQMAMLVDSGILVPVVPRSGAKKSYDWFRPNHVREVMDRMLGNLKVVDGAPNEMVTLTEMLARSRGALELVNAALLNGSVPAMRLADEKPYASILVSMNDVMLLMGQDPSEDAQFLTFEEFGSACGFNSGTACSLAVHGLVQSEFRISKSSGMRRRMIPKTEVERFQATYISATRLAVETGRSVRTITAEMANRGIEPVDTGKARLTLFERELVGQLTMR